MMSEMTFFNDDRVAPKKQHAAYYQYWLANADKMPRELLRINGGMLPHEHFESLADIIFLHDARIEYAKIDLPTFELRFHGDNRGALRYTTIHYGGVVRVSPIPKILLAEMPDSDLMCHETLIQDSGLFMHKMLFASGDVLCVEFESISLNVLDVGEPGTNGSL